MVNCLTDALIFTGVKMVEDGIAEASDIDKATRLALGHPMGPLQLADFVGLDICDSIRKNFHEANPSNPLYFPGVLARKVAEGKLGVKSGEGFYKYFGVNKSKL